MVLIPTVQGNHRLRLEKVALMESQSNIKSGVRQSVLDSLEHSLVDYADIWAEFAAWDTLSDEAWELVYRRGYATPTRLSVTNCDN